MIIRNPIDVVSVEKIKQTIEPYIADIVSTGSYESEWKKYISKEFLLSMYNEDVPLNRDKNLCKLFKTDLSKDMLSLVKSLFPDYKVENTGAFYYPPTGFMGWHTNHNNPCDRVYITYSLEDDKSFFRYYEKGKIITDYDNKGITIRRFTITGEAPYFWHCVGSECDRISFGYTLKPKPSTIILTKGTGELPERDYWYDQFRIYSLDYNCSPALFDYPVRNIIEIGARDCVETVWFASKFPDSKVTAFECNPRMIELCKKNIIVKRKQNGTRVYDDGSRIHLIEKMVTNNSDSNQFYLKQKDVDIDEGVASMFTPSFKYDTIEVDTIRMDDYLNDEIVDLLWIDVQGADLEVLESFGEKIKNVRMIFCEVDRISHDGIDREYEINHTEEEIFNKLEQTHIHERSYLFSDDTGSSVRTRWKLKSLTK